MEKGTTIYPTFWQMYALSELINSGMSEYEARATVFEDDMPLPQDKLDVMMGLQLELSDRVSINLHAFANSNPLVKVIWICRLVIATFVELVEMLNCIPWKWWKKNQTWKQAELEEEFIDVFHFVLNIGILIGFTPESLFEAYAKKNRVNHERQNNGY